MDRHDAAYAAGLIGAKTVMPMHYDTFPPIKTDPEAFSPRSSPRRHREVVVLDRARPATL